MQHYSSFTMDVSPDLIRPSDQRLLFVNYHFEYIPGSDYAWFNYLDPENTLINLGLKLPRNEFGIFDKAVIGKPVPVDLTSLADTVHSKPTRFTRCGNVVAMAFKDENLIVVKDVISGQVEIIKPQPYEQQIG